MANKENNFEKDINVPSKEQTNDSLKNSDKNFNENCTHDEERIIIDDVDVSKCTLYYYGRCNNACNPLNCLFCSDKPNCDFKQLARKTQECEKLNDKIIDMNSIIEDAAINLGNKDFTLYNLPFEIKKLRQECEIWKNQVLVLDEESVTVQVTQEQFEEYQKLRQQCKQLKEDYAELERECERLKSYGATLLADKNAMEIGRDDYIQRCKQLEQECEELKKQLMQKSEVDMFFNTPIEGWSNDPCGICPHKAENEELKEENQELRNSLSGSLMFRFTSQDKEVARYRKALEEIEKILKDEICEECPGKEGCKAGCKEHQCLDIISKAKGTKDD